MTAGHVGGDRTVVTTGFTMNARPLEGKVTWGERRLSLSLSLCRAMRARLTAHVQSAGIKPQSHLSPRRDAVNYNLSHTPQSIGPAIRFKVTF